MTVIPENITFDHLFIRDTTLVSDPELPATVCYDSVSVAADGKDAKGPFARVGSPSGD